MPDRLPDQTEIKDTDIVFDCPHCGKSLAIDYRGAGLMVPCTDCGKNVLVPIPEGMEITDIDSTEEQQEVRILNLRRSLHVAETKIDQLVRELQDVTLRRDRLERQRADTVTKFGTILEKAQLLQKATDDFAKALQEIVDTAKNEVNGRQQR